MDEVRARAIHCAEDLSSYSHEELAAADRWMRDYALGEFRAHLKRCSMSQRLRDWANGMARATYGSVETDSILTDLRCYPRWLLEHQDSKLGD